MQAIRSFFLKQLDDKRFVKILAVVMLITTALFIFVIKGENQAITVASQSEQSQAESEEGGEAPTTTVFVDVGGAVEHPGVYELSPSARVYEAIEMAGGLCKNADTASINQAEQVQDGSKIYIPDQNDAGSSAHTTSGAPDQQGGASVGLDAGSAVSSGGKVNINSAGLAELETLRGIGPATAQKIIDYRNANGRFTSIEDLKKVSGIGEKTFEKIQNAISV